jgi:hypothetical protein
MVTKFSDRKFGVRHLALGLALALSLVGCGSDGSSSTSAQSSALASSATEPFITHGVPETMVQVGAQYRYQTSTTNPWGLPLSYKVVNKPDWAVFNDTTGELSGTPQESDLGTSGNIEIAVSDGTTIATVGPFRIRVIPELHTTSAPTALTISGTPPSNVTAGGQYRFLPVVASAVEEPLSFSIINCPAWATFDTATGLLVGAPKSANVGTYSNIVISVSAAGSPVSLTPFTIQVEAAGSDAPTISGSPQTTVAAGGRYAFTPTVGDPNGNALTFTIMNAPAWANFSASTGELSGVAPSSSTAQLYANIVISVSDGTNSASLAAFSVEVQASSGGSGSHDTRFHPGYYVELDENASLATNLASIDSLRGAPNVVGVALTLNWSNMEFAKDVYFSGTPGDPSSAQGFYAVDLILQHCQAAGLQFVLDYADRVFGTNHGNYGNGAFVPPYMDTIENGSPGYLVAPAGTTWIGNLIAVVDVTNSQAWAREIALAVAYASRYNSNLNFEMLRSPETSIAEFNSTGQDDTYFANYLLWMQQVRAVAPNVGLSISTNFTAGVTNPNQFSTLFANCQLYGVAVGGPDVLYSESNPAQYLGYDNLVFNGYVGGKKWNNILAYVAENQYGDIYSSYGPSRLTQLYDFLFGSTPNSQTAGGGVTPNYWLIQAGQPGPGWSVATVANWIAAAPALNNALPSSY